MRMRAIWRDFHGRVVYFGSGPCADPQILSVAEDLKGLHVRYRAREHEGDFTLHMLGAHNALNALAGLAVALEAGVDLDEAVKAIASLTAGDKRGEVIEMGGVTILNDSYNSNPEALRSMIHTLAARPAAAAASWWPEKCWRWASTGPRCTSPVGARPLRLASIWLSRSRAMRNIWRRLRARAACRRCFSAMPRPPVNGSRKTCTRGCGAGKGSRGVHLERAIEAVGRHFCGG